MDGHATSCESSAEAATLFRRINATVASAVATVAAAAAGALSRDNISSLFLSLPRGGLCHEILVSSIGLREGGLSSSASSRPTLLCVALVPLPNNRLGLPHCILVLLAGVCLPTYTRVFVSVLRWCGRWRTGTSWRGPRWEDTFVVSFEARN